MAAQRIQYRTPSLVRLLVNPLFVCLVYAFNITQSFAQDVDFVRDIRPILSDKCFFCHGPDSSHREADLRLDDERNVKSDRGGYRIIVEGNTDESELVSRITAEDESERMPPGESGKALTAGEVALLTRWIEQGARWQQHWAYAQPTRFETPQIKNDNWSINWVDEFVFASIKTSGLAPNIEADRRTLIRRLYFDLIGLPPSPAAVKTFLDDNAIDAYERLVDELLASEHFGERIAMYWLDLVRYADTVGYHGDQDHHISPYRDWVIDALNANMPFDQFTREQLAGDLLKDSTIDQQIAAAYNRLLQTSHEGGVQPGEYLAIYAADRVRNVSAVWMGATMGCAQCHDHKYDPYTTRDFYSMAAFFSDIDEAQHLTKGVDAVPTVRHPEMKVFTRRERAAIDELEKEIRRVEAKSEQLQGSDDSFGRQLESLSSELEKIKAAQRTIMVTRALKKPRETRILPRGNWLDRSGDVVLPAVPSFMQMPILTAGRANRLDLANWLVDPESGAGNLTARVMVNRFWYLFFGSGISEDLADFGGQGQPPRHPQLLDRLAIELVESGWDIKHLVRLLVTSKAYRQSSIPTVAHREIDPGNRLFARQSRFRLPAEMIRDNALEISGLLVKKIGGPSVKPYQPAGYYRHLNFPQRVYQHDKSSAQWRRGLYVHWQRQFLQPMLKSFDAPMREECTAQRPRSNTPIAALALLNDPTFLEAARAFAARIIREGGDSLEKRLKFAFLTATSRRPNKTETESLRMLLERELGYYRENVEHANQILDIGLADKPQQNLPEHAAWTSVARVILNLNETITRN